MLRTQIQPMAESLNVSAWLSTVFTSMAGEGEGNGFTCCTLREPKSGASAMPSTRVVSHKRPPLPVPPPSCKPHDVTSSALPCLLGSNGKQNQFLEQSIRQAGDSTDIAKNHAVEKKIDTFDPLMSPRPPAGLPTNWKWPHWCLDYKKPDIEVFVVDEATGTKKWCKAEPRARVVDGQQEAFICCEYWWKGEIYMQDFGPHQIRKRGQKLTVFQLYDKTADGATDERLAEAHPFNGLGSFESAHSKDSDDQFLDRAAFKRRHRKRRLLVGWMAGAIGKNPSTAHQ